MRPCGGILSPKLIRSGNFKKMLLIFAIIFSGATMLFGEAGGYVLAAVAAFMAGVIVTVLIIRKRKRDRQKEEEEFSEKEGKDEK